MTTLKVLAKLKEPFVETIKNGTESRGYLIDIWKTIAMEAGIKYEMEVKSGGSRKILDDMVSTKGEYSIGLSDFSTNFYQMNETFDEAIEFSPPYLVTGFGAAVYLDQKTVSDTITLLVSSFSWQVWLSIFAMLLVNSLAFFAYTKVNRCTFDSSPAYVDENYGFVEGLWFSAGTFLRQGTDHRPKTLPLRIIAAAWYLFCLVFVTIYTAKLASTLTAEQIKYPVRHVDDLPIQSSIEYGTYGKITQSFFDGLGSDSQTRGLWHMMERWNTTKFKSWTELAEHAKKNRGRFAMIRKRTYLEDLAAKEKDCDLFVLAGTLNYDYLGIAMHKNLDPKIRSKISSVLLTLARNGVLQRKQAYYWQTQTCSMIQAHKKMKDTASLGIEYFLGVFIIVGLIYFVSFVSFIVELFYLRQIMNLKQTPENSEFMSPSPPLSTKNAKA